MIVASMHAADEAQARGGDRAEVPARHGERELAAAAVQRAVDEQDGHAREQEAQDRRDLLVVAADVGVRQDVERHERHGIPALSGRTLTWPRLAAADRAALAVAWRALWVSRLVVWLGGLGALGDLGRLGARRRLRPGRRDRAVRRARRRARGAGRRWDAVWFLAIANDGYGDERARGVLPAVPAAGEAGGAVIGSPVVAGILVSTAAFLAALGRCCTGSPSSSWARAPRAARSGASRCFPMAFFRSAVYSESLFLALSVGAVYAARTERWAWAGGARRRSAAATRSAGVLLVVPLVLLHVDAHGWRRRSSLAWLGAGAARARGVLRRARAGGRRPAGAVRAPRTCGSARSPGRSWAPGTAPWRRGTARASSPPARASACTSRRGRRRHGGVAPQPRAVRVPRRSRCPRSSASPRRLPLAYVAYAVAALALPLSYPVAPQPLMSLPRFLLVLFPLFMWLGLVGVARRPRRGPLRSSAVGSPGSPRSPRSSRPGTGSRDAGRCPARRARDAGRPAAPVAAARRAARRARRRGHRGRGAGGAAGGDRLLPRAPRRWPATARGSPSCAGAARRCCARRCPSTRVEVGDLERGAARSLRFRPIRRCRRRSRALRERGARLVVVSNWDVSLHDVLRDTGLDALLDGVVTSAEIGAAKPDPAHVPPRARARGRRRAGGGAARRRRPRRRRRGRAGGGDHAGARRRATASGPPAGRARWCAALRRTPTLERRMSIPPPWHAGLRQPRAAAGAAGGPGRRRRRPRGLPPWRPWTSIVALVAAFAGDARRRAARHVDRRRDRCATSRTRRPRSTSSRTVVAGRLPHRGGAVLRAHGAAATPRSSGFARRASGAPPADRR